MKIKIRDLTFLALAVASFTAFTFYGLDFWNPLYCSNPSRWFIGCSIVVVLLSLYSLLRNGIKNITCADVLVFVLLLISIFWNNDYLASGLITIELKLAWTVVLYFALRNTRYNSWMEFFIKILAVVGLVYSFFTIISYLSPDFYYSVIFEKIVSMLPDLSGRLKALYESGYMSGITAHYSTNGIYIGLGIIPYFVYFFCSKKLFSKAWHRVHLLLFAFVLLALLLTGKRAHVIFTIVALIIVLYLYNSDKKLSRIFKLIFIVGLAALAIYIVSMFIPEVMNVVNRFVQLSETTGIDNGREAMSEYALKAFAQNPLFGNGWLWFPIYNSVSPGDYAHNVYYELLCDVGIVGTAIILSLFVVMLIRAIRLLMKLSKHKELYPEQYRMIACCAVGYEIFFLLYCTTGNPLYEYSCYLPYFLFGCMVETLTLKLNNGTILQQLSRQ